MSSTEEQLKRIHEKLQHLLKQHAAVQKENLQLREDLNQSKQQAVSYQQNVESLRQQVDVLKLSSGEMNEVDKKEFERRINGYLKEIDRCIALLSE